MGKELATTSKAANTVAALIKKTGPQFAMAMGKAMDPDRFVRTCITTVRTTPALARCNPQSLLGALMQCAQLQLDPGPLGHAYLVPFGSEATLIIGYKGLIELAYRSKQVILVQARTVHENDQFRQVLGTEDRLEHVPPPFGQDRGAVVGVYATAKLSTGATVFEVLTRDEVEQFRAMSRGKNSPAWKDHWNAMAKKTVVRRLATWLPMATDLQKAVEAENAWERGEAPTVEVLDQDAEDAPYIENDQADAAAEAAPN